MRMLIIGVVLLGLSGCHLTMATPSGLREYGKTLNGLVTTGKSAPNVPDSYFINQDKETQGRWKGYTSYANQEQGS